VLFEASMRLRRIANKPSKGEPSAMSLTPVKTHLPLVDLKRQYAAIQPEIQAAIDRVLQNTDFIMGRDVAEFEAEFAAFCAVKHVIGVASGTAAIHLVLEALNIGPGDEVISVANTFIATVEPIIWLGAKPVFVDVHPDYATLDPEKLEAAITSHTRAIMPVDLYGQCAQMDKISEIAARHGIPVIEDAAQAQGTEYCGRRAGTWGTASCFSFYPGKNLGAYGDAGAVATTDGALAERLRRRRNHGRSSKYEHIEVGYAERLDTLQAAILRAKLSHLDNWNETRRRLAASYDEALKDIPDVQTPKVNPDGIPIYHLYVIQHPQRDRLAEHLQTQGIQTGVHYPLPLHLQPALRSLGYQRGDLPITEHLAGQILSLPIFPEMTADEVDMVAAAVRSFSG
jgi:dTDP-4-amino-4,6-dideoxygalactose transaminase